MQNEFDGAQKDQKKAAEKNHEVEQKYFAKRLEIIIRWQPAGNHIPKPSLDFVRFFYYLVFVGWIDTIVRIDLHGSLSPSNIGSETGLRPDFFHNKNKK